MDDWTTKAAAGAPPADGWRPLGMLVVESPHWLAGLSLPVAGPEAVVGRDGDVRLGSARVSRRHAVIWSADGRVWVRDDGSVNGSYVNGIRLTEPRRLVDGDRLQFGDVAAVFSTGVAMARPPARSTPPFRAAEPAAHAPMPPVPEPPVPEPPVPDPRVPEPLYAGTETTRYLCAATQLDRRRFRRVVLDATVRETRRAVCPSYGVDLSVVARHAVVAERRDLLRDAVLTAAILLGVWVVGVWAASADVTALVRGGDWETLARRAADVLPAAAILLAITLIVVAADASARLSTLSRMLRRGGRPADLPRPSGRVAAVLDELAEANSGNVVVFTVFDPFVGSGLVVDAASFTVPLIPRDEPEWETAPRLPPLLHAGDVIDALDGSLRTLRVPHLRIDTRLFVDGYDVALFPDLLPDPMLRPRTHAPPPLLRETIERPVGSVRPYLCVEFTSWQGQLVVTSFIRVVALPGVLYVENATYMLPPLKATYYKVDEMRIRTVGERLSATLRATGREWLPALLTSPYWLAVTVARRLSTAQRERQHRRWVADRVLIDYGAVTSVREQASGDRYQSYFMEQDTDMYVKIVQQKMLDTITALLDARGYQIDKIKQIQDTTSVSMFGANVGAIGPYSKGDRGRGGSVEATGRPGSIRSYGWGHGRLRHQATGSRPASR